MAGQDLPYKPGWRLTEIGLFSSNCVTIFTDRFALLCAKPLALSPLHHQVFNSPG
jgi:hypothetical protein